MARGSPDARFDRRRAMLGGAAVFVVGAAGPVAVRAVQRGERRAPTPSQPEGPHYPTPRPLGAGSDLSRVGALEARGERIELAGRVRDLAGRPIAGALVEIWHGDRRGVYAGPDRDPGFAGYGAAYADGEGAYGFWTVRPAVAVDGLRGIHVKARAPGSTAPLTTRMFFPHDRSIHRHPEIRPGGPLGALIAGHICSFHTTYLFDLTLDA